MCQELRLEKGKFISEIKKIKKNFTITKVLHATKA